MLTWQQTVEDRDIELSGTWTEDDWRGTTRQDFTDGQKQYHATMLVARMLAAFLDTQKVKVI